jgi:hypothetical protein
MVVANRSTAIRLAFWFGAALGSATGTDGAAMAIYGEHMRNIRP